MIKLRPIFDTGFPYGFDSLCPPDGVDRMRRLIEARRKEGTFSNEAVSTDYVIADLKWHASFFRMSRRDLGSDGKENRGKVKAELAHLLKALEQVSSASDVLQRLIGPRYGKLSHTAFDLLRQANSAAGGTSYSDPLNWTTAVQDGTALRDLQYWAEAASSLVDRAREPLKKAGQTPGSSDQEYVASCLNSWLLLAQTTEKPPKNDFQDFAHAAFALAGMAPESTVEGVVRVVLRTYAPKSAPPEIPTADAQTDLVRYVAEAERQLAEEQACWRQDQGGNE